MILIRCIKNKKRIFSSIKDSLNCYTSQHPKYESTNNLKNTIVIVTWNKNFKNLIINYKIGV